MKKILLTLLITLSLFGCKQIAIDNITYITDENLPPVKELEFEKIDVPEELNMRSTFYVFDDTIMIISAFHPDPYFLKVVNMNNWETIAGYFRRGQGPNEMIRLWENGGNRKIFASDLVTDRRYIMYVDSMTEKRQNYHPTQIGYFTRFVGAFDELNDTTVVYYNETFYKDKNMSFDDSIPEFYFTDKNGTPYKKPISNTMFTSLVNQNVLLSNIKKNRVVVGHGHRPIVKFYDTDMNLLKEVSGPDPDDCEDISINLELPSIWHNDHNCSYYDLTSTATDNYAILLNRRIHRDYNFNTVKHFQENGYGQDTYEILFFDWDGNVVARFRNAGMKIHQMTYCEKSSTLYVTAFDENEEQQLYKAKVEL